MKYLVYIIMGLAGILPPEDIIVEKVKQKEIEWCEHRKLHWLDFQGQPESYNHFSAISATYIEEEHGCSEDGDFKYHVKAVFLKDESWSTNKYSDELLKHEQAHFDITEIHARKLRHHFSQLIDPCSIPQDKLLEQVDSLYTEMVKAHNEFDRVTRHGLDRNNQKRWDKFIQTKLGSLVYFKQ